MNECIERERDRKKDTFRETNLLLTLFNIHDLSVYPQNHLNFPVVKVSHKNTGGQDRPTLL